MNLDNHYQKTPECLLEDMHGEMLLFNPGNATTLHLKGRSALVWELCNGEHSLAIMIDILKQANPTQADQIEGDVMAAIKELLENEVIQIVVGQQVPN